jgi:transposase
MQKGKFVLHHSKQRKAKTIYVYYMIAWYFRKDGKPFRNVIKHLGHLNEYEVEYYQNTIACLNNEPHVIPCNINRVFVRNSKEYISCAVGIHFWDYWELSTVFKNSTDQKDVSTTDIAKILTILRLVKPCSKNFTTGLYPETCLPQLVGVSPSSYNKTRVFRELEDIENHREELGKHIFHLAKEKGYTKGELLFYDLSSGNISGLRCVMAKWGHCKDGYRTHVVLLLVITPEGYPIYWEILEGNTADANTVEDLVCKVEQIYGKIESIICFDRGMVSDENLRLLEGRNIQFITALDGNQVKYFQEFINFTLINKVKRLDIKKQSDKIEEYLTNGGFNFVQKNLYFKEIKLIATQKENIEKVTNKLNLDKRRYFLAFNPELAYLTHKHRKERVKEFSKWVEQYNSELSQALGDRKKESVEKAIKAELKRRKIANIDIKYNLSKYRVENRNKDGKTKKSTTYKITLGKIAAKEYKKAKEYDGLWVLVTNISETDDDKFFNKANFDNFFEIYRLKNTIEESFKILSDFVEVEPFYVYKTEHIKAHFTICVLSYLIDTTILNKIRHSDNIENIDLHNVFHILRKCKQDTIQLDEKTVVSQITQLTEKQKELLDVLNCSYLVSPKYLYDNKITSIDKYRA